LFPENTRNIKEAIENISQIVNPFHLASSERNCGSNGSALIFIYELVGTVPIG